MAVPGLGREIEVKIASTQAEWEQAFELVADNYQACGYEAGDYDYRFTSYHVLPDTAVFVAKDRERVVATFSLVADNELLGLPMEKTYHPEVQDLRRQGRRLAEVTSLASRDLSLREFLVVFPALIRLMKQYHIRSVATAGSSTSRLVTGSTIAIRLATATGGRRACPRSRHRRRGLPARHALDETAHPRAYRQMFGKALPAAACVRCGFLRTGAPFQQPLQPDRRTPGG